MMSSTENVVTDQRKQGWLAVHNTRGNNLTVVAIGAIRVSIVSGISKVSISSIQKVGVSLGLSISGALSIVSKSMVSIGVSVVSSISKVSISSIKKVGVSISLWLSLSLTLANIAIS